MKRLRDQRDSADPIVAEAARLLAARAPLAEDTMRRQRVRARLRRRRTAPRGAMWLRAAAMVLLVCSVAAASAMIGRVAQTIRARIEEKRAAKQQKEHAQGHRHHATATTAPLAPTGPLAPTPPIAAPATVPSTSPIARTPPSAPARLAAASTPSPAAAAAPPPPPHRAPAAAGPIVDAPSEEERLVAAAVRALRHEHDPARAARLLERYLDRYPDGAAAEDALALALEATLGRDPPRAAGFATRYLTRYPAGRWSSLARRAIEP